MGPGLTGMKIWCYHSSKNFKSFSIWIELRDLMYLNLLTVQIYVIYVSASFFYQTGNYLLSIKIVEFLWWISSKLTKKIYADAISVFYFRSSLPEAFYKKYVKSFAKLAGKHMCPSLFFNKVACLRHGILLKKRLLQGRFPVNFAKF